MTTDDVISPECAYCPLFLDYEVQKEALTEAEDTFYSLKQDFRDLNDYACKLRKILDDNEIAYPSMYD